MKPLPNWMLGAAACFFLLLIFGNNKGCSLVTGEKGAFVTDLPAAALFVVERTQASSLTPDQQNIIDGNDAASVRGVIQAKGGKVERIDKDNVPTTFADKWTQDAFAAWQAAKLPTPAMLLSTKNGRGFTKALSADTKEADVLSQVTDAIGK